MEANPASLYRTRKLFGVAGEVGQWILKAGHEPRLFLIHYYWTIPPITAGGVVREGSSPMLGSTQSAIVGNVYAFRLAERSAQPAASCLILCDFSSAFTK